MRSSRMVSRWRWLAAVGVLALIATACQAETGDTTTTTAGPGDTTTTTGADPTTTTTQPPGPEGFTFKVGIFNDLTTDNFWAYYGPESEVWNSYVLGPTVPSLFTLAYPGIVLVPDVAEGAPVAAVQDGDNWVVVQPIRQGYMWSDGVELTAEDVAFTFNTAKDLVLGGNWLSAYQLYTPAQEDDPATEDVDETAAERDGILSVEATGTYEVTITFSAEPGLAIWQNGIGLGPILPKHFWEGNVEEAKGSDDPATALYAFSGEGMPSGGTMVYGGREPGAFATNTAFADEFWAGTEYTFYTDGSYKQSNPNKGVDECFFGSCSGDTFVEYTEGPYASTVQYSIYTDQSAAILALEQGEIDYLLTPLGLQAGLRERVLNAENLSLIANGSNGFRYLAFNMRKEPMSLLGFRKGLSCMINKEFMAQNVLQGAVLPAYSLVPIANTFWANPDVEQLCKDLSEEERLTSAVEFMKADGFTWTTEPSWDADAGDAIPGEGLSGPGGTVAELELLAPGPGYDPLRATYSVWIQNFARDLGIPLTANPTGFSVIVDKAFAEGDLALDWDMYILGWGLGDPSLPTFHEAFFASYNDSAAGGFNTPGYANDQVDQLAADLLAATDIETARGIVRQMDALIVSEYPYVVLFQTPILEAYRQGVVWPFTDTLDGLQNLSGVPALVQLAD